MSEGAALALPALTIDATLAVTSTAPTSAARTLDGAAPAAPRPAPAVVAATRADRVKGAKRRRRREPLT